MKNVLNGTKRCVSLLLCLTVFFCLCGCTRSQNKGARKYQNGSCIAFYPEGNDEILSYVRDLCWSGRERIYDYRMEASGDLYLVSYSGGESFYVDPNGHEVSVDVVSGEKILSDHLRYQMKKEGIGEAYTSKYWVDTAPENLDLSRFSAKIANGEILVHDAGYDADFTLEMGQLKAISGIDPGVEEMQEETPIYIDPERPMIAITYDDGPYDPVDEKLFELYDRYGGRATFFYVGERITRDELPLIEKGVSLNMEFGSHTETHADLSKMYANDARREVYGPIDYVEEKTGYAMKSYRPPYGARNFSMEELLDIPSILWNVDSRDWSNRDPYATYERIMEVIDDHDVILMHSLYDSSLEASEKLIPELIDRGYQLVTVSEMMEILDLKGDKSFGGW